MGSVASLLPESTTMISLQKSRAARVRSMSCASLKVIITALIGTILCAFMFHYAPIHPDCAIDH